MKTYTVLLFSVLIAKGEKCCSEVSQTKNGFTCQRWDTSKSDFKVRYSLFVDYPQRTKYRPAKSNHNHCAAADPGDKKPFCYTTDPEKRWEYCDCKTSCAPPKSTSVLTERKCCSEVSNTKSGRSCQRWDTS